MKDKILQKLKQEYSSLGLGDVILTAHAESLAKLGLVTDDNIDTVIEAQKDFLSNIQRQTDSRVTDAVEKTKKKAKEDEDARKKAEEEARAKKKTEEEKRKAEEEANKDIPENFIKLLEERESKLLKELTAKNKILQDSFDALKKATEEEALAKAKKERADMILSKAKEFGIPQYRIDEGFFIGDDADDSAISSYLSNVAKNIKANAFPSAAGHYVQEDLSKPSDEQIEDVASMLVN